jgi:hypothetical protein
MAIALSGRYTARIAKMFPADGDQWVEWPSSLLPVANRIEVKKTATMTGTTKNGEVMCIPQTPYCYLE